MDFNEIRTHPRTAVCQHYYPRKEEWCGAPALYVVGKIEYGVGSGACKAHVGALILDEVGLENADLLQVTVYQAHWWDHLIRPS